MTIFTDGLRLEPENRGVTEYAASYFGDVLGATVRETLADSPTSQLLGIGELEYAKGKNLSRMSGVDDALTFGGGATPAPAVPTISKLEAADRVKAAGLDKDLKLHDQDSIAEPALDIMINRARDRRERQAMLERGPQGWLPWIGTTGTSFLVGAIDPLNLASAFIPVMGELRYGKLLADAGTSFTGRTAVRLGVGGAQGVVGQAALEPLDWYSHTQDGRDFGMADVLHKLVFGAALGGGLHSIGGGIRDVYRSRKGLAQYPFGPGEPMEHVSGTHVLESVLADAGVARGDMPEHLQPIVDDIEQLLAARNTPPALSILRDLPPRAQEDSMRAALASIVDGEPVKVGEMLHAAAQTDPRIAESFEAWHGSPHAIDRFSSDHIGTGEGAQVYGHGLYFAENEKVAREYQRSTTGRDFIRKAQELYSENDSPNDAHAAIVESKEFTPGQKRLLLALEKDEWLGFDYPHQAVSAALSDPHGKNWEMSPETLDAIKHVGNIYKVRVNASHDRFLDWDKPLSEQSEHVRSKLRGAGFQDQQTGKDIYHSLVKYRPDQGGGMTSAGMRLSDLDATPGQASGRLSATGIDGIKYLDAGSRGGGTPEWRAYQEGESFYVAGRKPREAGPFKSLDEAQSWIRDHATRNFVVFDDKHIEITHRNGEPVGLEMATPEPKAAPAGDRGPAIPDLVTAPKPRGRAAAHPDTLSLNEHLASKGGLRPAPELAAIYGGDRGPFIPSFGPLVRKSGMSLDEALSSAKQHGYMFDPHDIDNGSAGVAGRTSHGLTPNDLLDHLDAENRGQKLYKPGHVEATKFDPEQEKHVVLGHVEAEFEAAGLKVSDIDGKLLDRTVEIVHREGERDVLAAYERAIMEDEERYHAIAAARDTASAHPGRDVPFDAGTAPGGSRVDPISSGPARRAGPGDRGADGAQPSRDGTGDPGARDAAWRELAATRPDVDDVNLQAASRAADALPEPVQSNLDKRLSAAENADAYAKQMYDMFADRLPAEDRQRLDDLIKSIDGDAATRREAIERSGACLFGARS